MKYLKWILLLSAILLIIISICSILKIKSVIAFGLSIVIVVALLVLNFCNFKYINDIKKKYDL